MYTELIRLFFRREEFGPLRFPDELDSLYGTVVDGLIGTAPAIAHNQYRIDDETFESIGAQFCRYFPAHFFKAYAAQRDMESACFAEENDTRFLGWPATMLIDIGCGAGAVSLAHLALLLRFQQHLLENGSSISPINVSLIGIDTNQYMLDLYKQMVERFSKMLTPYLIRVQFEIVKAAFPSNEINQIFHLPKPTQRHYVLLGLSNIIRPLDDMYLRNETVWIEKISQALEGEPITESSFGSAESRTIERFMQEWQVDRLGILGIVTKDRSALGKPWKQYLAQLDERITERLSLQHAVTVNRVFDDQEFAFINPPKSIWRTQTRKVEHHGNFSWRHLEISNREFVQDEQWHQLLEYSNLELAWARARSYAFREALTDDIELRLFDVDTEIKLRRLRAFMFMKDWDQLNTQHLVQFDSPKSESESRPKTIARLEEQILATALIQVYGHNAAREKSYSYRLKTDGGEFLYEYWLDAWKSFIADTHELAQDRSVLRADIREFYKHIEQDRLMTIASRTFQLTSKRANELLGALIKRNCGTGHLPGFGLPQGHIASGYWADIFLSTLDKLIESEFPQNVAFARYADDMFFSYSGNINDVEQRLSNYASRLGLELSAPKTKLQTSGEYLASTGLDPMLEVLAEQRYKPVVNDRVFRLDFGHWTLYESSDQSFLENYRMALRSIGIYMSIPWIQRKLRQNHMKGGKLFWPNSDYLFSNLERWVSEFQNLNRQWLNEVAELRQELTRVCFESYATMNTDKLDEADLVKSQRRFRFAAHRLCSLGLPDALSELVVDELINYPWRVSARLLCPGLAATNRADLLLKIMRESTHAYVRSVSAWSLGFVDFDTAGELLDSARRDLAELMFSESSTFHERLKSSEALLMLGTNEMIDFDQVLNLVHQEENPYLKKNFLLLLHRVSHTETLRLLPLLTEDCRELIIGDAIQEVRRGHPELKNLPKADPALVQRYYSVYYPVSEVDDTISEAPSQEIL